MKYTVLSKRKLKWFIENGHAQTWDDPRFPTVKGIIRRGLTVEGLTRFMLEQGKSKNTVLMEWDKILSINAKVLDPVAPRFVSIRANNKVEVQIQNMQNTPYYVEKPLHPGNPEMGSRPVCCDSVVYIDEDEVNELEVGQVVNFWGLGLCEVTTLNKNDNGYEIVVTYQPENTNFKKRTTVNFLAKS